MINSMYIPEQIALQTFLSNGLIHKSSVAFATSVAYARHCTQKQLFFINKMIQDVVSPPAPSGVVHDTSKLHLLFQNALKHLKYPKINLHTQAGSPVRFSVSKNDHNTIWMNAAGYGSQYYGKIVSGVVQFQKNVDTVDMMKLICEFAADPAACTATHGKLNHSCCYCSKGLTTTESLNVGYGPDCAKHYDLPWGTKVPKSKPTVDQLIPMDEARGY